jgi:glycosyltransferase involved in cell wall biosynthesis
VADFFQPAWFKMNIVVFGNATGWGGAQTAFRRLVDFLAADGHSVGIIGLVKAEDKLPTSGGRRPAFALRIENQMGSHVKKLAQTLWAGLRARQFRPHFFVSIGLMKSSALIARMLPEETFCIGQEFICGRDINDPLMKSAVRSFDALAVQSPSMIDVLRARGFNELPLSWLPCFPHAPCAGFSRQPRLNRPEIRLGYFGRIEPLKGLEGLLQALAIAKCCAPVILDIWGSGGEINKLKRIAAELGLSDSIAFRGRYPEGVDYARLICSYDGLMLPSLGLEGLPLILLEAMAYGVPIFTTRVGAISDCCVNNEDAVLVEPNVEALRIGLEEFVGRAAANTFSTERLIRYYQIHFGFEALAGRWRKMMADPQNFFSCNG